MPDNDIDDIIQLRAIIHGLRVAGLSFVDQEALTHIQQRIKNLPSPEALTEMSGKRDMIKKLSEEVGEIIRLIEIYGKRDEESKYRNISIKGLPPRYKILEWRQAMNIDKNIAIRNLVNLSSSVDKKGQTKLASRLIVCAKSIQEDKVTEQDIENLLSEIKASGNEDLMKEAGISDWWAGVKGGMQGAWQGAKNLGHQVADPMKTQAAFNRAMKFMQNLDQNILGLLESVGAAYNFVQPYGNKVMTNALAQIYQNIQGFQSNSKQIQAKLSEVDMNLKQTTVRGDAGDPLAAQQQGGQPEGQPGGQPGQDVAPEGMSDVQSALPISAGQTPSAPRGLDDYSMEEIQAALQRKQQAQQAQQASQGGGAVNPQPQAARAKKPANPAARKPRTNKPQSEMEPFNMQDQMGAIGNISNKFLKNSNQ